MSATFQALGRPYSPYSMLDQMCKIMTMQSFSLLTALVESKKEKRIAPKLNIETGTKPGVKFRQKRFSSELRLTPIRWIKIIKINKY